jgi:hypothetical protein
MSSSSLGRDPRYMTIDHGADNLWNQYLDVNLGVFKMGEDLQEIGEYSM